MTPLTPREAVCRLVETSADYTKKPVPRLWDELYGRFEYQKNHNYRRMAYVNGATTLDLIEEMGVMGELLAVAQGFLKQDPALPDKEKGPLQGSLID